MYHPIGSVYIINIRNRDSLYQKWAGIYRFVFQIFVVIGTLGQPRRSVNPDLFPGMPRIFTRCQWSVASIETGNVRFGLGGHFLFEVIFIIHPHNQVIVQPNIQFILRNLFNGRITFGFYIGFHVLIFLYEASVYGRFPNGFCQSQPVDGLYKQRIIGVGP